MLELAQAEFHIRGADFGGVLASLIQHLIRHVDADHVIDVAGLPRYQKAVEAHTAAQVDNHLTRLQGCDRLGIAAAKTEIGAFENSGELGIRIAHLSRFFRRRAGRGISTEERHVFEILSSHRQLQANSDLFLAEMPGSAPTYKGEADALRKQTGGTRP